MRRQVQLESLQDAVLGYRAEGLGQVLLNQPYYFCPGKDLLFSSGKTATPDSVAFPGRAPTPVECSPGSAPAVSLLGKEVRGATLPAVPATLALVLPSIASTVSAKNVLTCARTDGSFVCEVAPETLLAPAPLFEPIELRETRPEQI